MSGLRDILLALAALAAATAGFTALSLAMERHWEQLYGRGAALPARARRGLRHAGAVGLLASLAACIALRGAAQGWVAWAGVLTLAGITLVLVLGYAARGVARLGWCSGALAMLSLAGALLA